MSAAAKPTMHILIIAVWVSLVGASVAPLQATTAIDVPSWATFPETLGDFKRDPSRDLAQYAILARYTREAAHSDVYVYQIPQVDGTPMSLAEEAAFSLETLLKLRGQGYDRVELVDASLPLNETIGEERIEGLMVGAMVMIEGQWARTYTTLLNVRGYRLKIRTTIRDRKSDVEGTIAFVRALLRAVLKGKQVLHPASGAHSDTALWST